jgi:AcrR family transcriptional regulator
MTTFGIFDKTENRMQAAKRKPRNTSANQSMMRQSICDAALAIFRRSGSEAVSMRAIASELGMSTMAPYNYFTGRDELFLEVRAGLFRQLTDYMNARVTNDDPKSALEQVCRAYFSYGHTHSAEYQLLFDTWDFDDYRAVISKYGPERLRNVKPWEILLDHVESYVKTTRSSADSQLASHLIWGQMHGVLSLHLAQKLVFGVSFNDLVKATIPAIFRLLAPGETQND